MLLLRAHCLRGFWKSKYCPPIFLLSTFSLEQEATRFCCKGTILSVPLDDYEATLLDGKINASPCRSPPAFCNFSFLKLLESHEIAEDSFRHSYMPLSVAEKLDRGLILLLLWQACMNGLIYLDCGFRPFLFPCIKPGANMGRGRKCMDPRCTMYPQDDY